MEKVVVARRPRNNSVWMAFGHAQDTFGSMKLIGRSMSELRLGGGGPNVPSDSHRRTSSWVDLTDHHPATISSSKDQTVKQKKGASKDDKLNTAAISESKRLGRWWEDLRHRRDRKKIDESTTGQENPVQTKESRNVSAKASIWKRLLAKLKGQAQKIRPARSDSITPPESQQAYPLPRPESFRMPRTQEAVNLRRFSSLHSHIMHSQLLQVQEAAPLWQRRKVRQPAPLDSRATKLNRNRRSSQK
ncbi:hypothetical protein O6H91_Y095500 [Diphasiastrum complanatum]|nr:hypothetical protein O6H91_Y095500 [Diphasiastrum complanatum]